ncbi:Cysteine-rich secretory protein 2 [Mactra antiquata]
MDYVIKHWIIVLIIYSQTSTVWTQDNVITFKPEEIKEIVSIHNNLRRSVYNAANMRELTWNEAVSSAASEWGTQCEYISRPDHQWGQNMNYYHGNDYHNSSIELFRDSFYAWANETLHYDYRRYRYCGGNNVCSYVQLIAADVQEIGCAIVKCPKLELQSPHAVQRHAKLLVCFYTPWVDILGSEVFIPDKRCAACPLGTSCVDNLCSARFNQPGARTLQLSSQSVKIESISGTRKEVTRRRPGPRGETSTPQVIKKSKEERRRERKQKREKKRRRTNRIIGSNNSFGSQIPEDNRVYQEYRQNPDSYSIRKDNDTIVVYTPNNRVIPFPGKEENRIIRRIEKYERKQEKDLDEKQEKIIHELELIANNVTVTNNTSSQNGHSRKKRQASYQDALYLRRLEYQRYLREYEQLMRERRLRRERYEQELRRRERHNEALMELRRADEVFRYNEELERRRQRRLQQERERYEALALTRNEGEMTGEEQFFTISAHNLLRREVGAKDLAWSSHLERWAKYVIRCETEYPGPITCYTNFGKADRDQEIYNVVYSWGAEGNDVNRPLRYGCRTPYDKSLCNHNTIVTDRSLRQMACASKNCGLQRQLTCIYSTD